MKLASARMFTISFCVMAAALLIAMVLLVSQDYYARRQDFSQDARMRARVIGENVAAAISFGDAAAATGVLDSLRTSSDVVAAAVYRDAGVFAEYHRDRVHTALPARPSPGQRETGSYLEVVELVTLNNRAVGAVVLRADTERLSVGLQRYGITALVLFCATLAGAYLLLARMRRTMTSAEQRLDYLAHFDMLTGLPNRNGFSAILEQAIGRARRSGSQMALLFVDLDDFKLVNDTLGHLAGDELLAAVAERIRRRLRTGDTVSRLGGDEFTILLEQLEDPAHAGKVAHAVVGELSRAFEIQGQPVHIGASVGICLYPGDATSAADMLRNADTAMYRAKESGKKRHAYFTEGMTQEQQTRFAIENGLRTALKSGGLRLVYQPQVELADGRVTGFEALLRWDHPEFGRAGPAEYLRIAESSDLIEAIGDWVLREACEQAMRWQAAGLPPVTVAVNIAVRQLRRKRLVEEVQQILQDTGLDPCRLELEVTEGGLMQDPDAAAATLARLRAMGVQISIDDFGTGYSSLAYLRSLPVQRLKIDKSFVRHIDRTPEDASIARAVIALAGSLRLQTLAEGVETAAELQLLRELGCWGVQGYFFSRPLPPDGAADFLRRCGPSGRVRLPGPADEARAA